MLDKLSYMCYNIGRSGDCVYLTLIYLYFLEVFVMSKSISIRMSDDDLRYVDYLARRYYGSDLVSNDKLNLPLSPVIRASFKLLYQILIENPDVCLEDPDFDYRLPDRFYPYAYDLDSGVLLYTR